MRPLEGLLRPRFLDAAARADGHAAAGRGRRRGASRSSGPGDGEEMRGYEPRWGRDSVNFALLNRGKKSIAARPEGPGRRVIACSTARSRRADVVRGAVPSRRDGRGWGSATTPCAAQNPRIIYCSITGYGQTGPKRDAAGHDLNYIGDTGLLALRWGPPGARVVPPALIADIAGGAYPAVINILLALRRARRTGRGRLPRHRHDRQPVPVPVLGDRQRARPPGNGPATAPTSSPAARRATGSTRPRTAASSPPRRSSRSSGRCSATRSGWSRSSRDDARDPGGHDGARRRDHALAHAAEWARDLRGGGLLLLDRAGCAGRAG